jgi:uncharacterized phosphosugar-binding protein
MVMPRQPIDLAGHPIPVLALPIACEKLAYTDAAVRSTALTVAGEKVFTLVATTDCHVAQGDVTVVATTSGYPLSAATPLDIRVTEGSPYVSVRRFGLDNGDLYVCERV